MSNFTIDPLYKSIQENLFLANKEIEKIKEDKLSILNLNQKLEEIQKRMEGGGEDHKIQMESLKTFYENELKKQIKIHEEKVQEHIVRFKELEQKNKNVFNSFQEKQENIFKKGEYVVNSLLQEVGEKNKIQVDILNQEHEKEVSLLNQKYEEKVFTLQRQMDSELIEYKGLYQQLEERNKTLEDLLIKKNQELEQEKNYYKKLISSHEGYLQNLKREQEEKYQQLLISTGKQHSGKNASLIIRRLVNLIEKDKDGKKIEALRQKKFSDLFKSEKNSEKDPLKEIEDYLDQE